MAYSDYNWITDRLAIGGLVSDSQGDLPFDAILSMETAAPTTLGELVKSGRVQYEWRSIIDGCCWETHDDIVRRFDDAAELLREWVTGNRRVLVHCFAGVSRSVTAVVWFLVRYESMSWDEAMELIRRARTQANPNVRFEVPLRMACGETIDEVWLEERIRVYCEGLRQYEIQAEPEEVWADLERQGTLRRSEVATG